jgi:membrane protease subunit HflK
MSDFDDNGFPRIIKSSKGGSGRSGGGPQLPTDFPEFDPEQTGRFALYGLLAAILAWGVWSTYFQVGTDEDAVVLRFGSYLRTAGPGPHLKAPFGVDRVYRVPTKRQMKMEFGFRTSKAQQRSAYSRGNSAKGESIMLTGDLNVVDVEWVVQYQIRDPKAYLFHARGIDLVIRDLSEAVLRLVVGDVGVNYVLTGGREVIVQQVKDVLSEAVAMYDLGIAIDQVIIQDVNPPEAVKQSFNEVNEAQQEREEAINMAKKAYNNAVPKARGSAEQLVSQAEGYAMERVNVSKGDVANFVAMQEAYSKSRSVTRARLHLETLQEVLPKISRKWVIAGAKAGVLKHMDLGKGLK